MTNKQISDIIKESVQKQNERIDKKLTELRGTDAAHFTVLRLKCEKTKPITIPPSKPGETARELSKIIADAPLYGLYGPTRVRVYDAMGPLENLDIPPELPPEFMFMHERVFLEGEPIENVDPDVASAGPKKWWEQDLRYVESETFDYTGVLEAEDRAELLARKWKNETVAPS